ncbi:MAG: DJ-1/PfpI family protein [Planctomycetia bacterium]|nr:DJ-1/PfpI family protein [Planctomycetia bacterium]
MKVRSVDIFIFDEVEVLDFAGPFEVFSVTDWQKDPKPFCVSLVSEKPGPILARNGFSVNPHHAFMDDHPADIIIVPGGFGTRREMHNPTVLNWVRQHAAKGTMILSVCTGSLILGAAGLLDGLEATTHHLRYDLLQETAPQCRVQRQRRVVDAGNIVTSGGIAAGIDMSFHVVARLLGEQTARETAEYMEYPWKVMS